jgi:hypothetical protein
MDRAHDVVVQVHAADAWVHGVLIEPKLLNLRWMPMIKT